MLTDRDERALLAAAENRISEPLRIGVALAAVRRRLTRRPPVAAQERESVTCHPTPIRTARPLQPLQPLQALQPLQPLEPPQPPQPIQAGLPTHR
ncbi:hypothetical protein ACFWBN_08015 [Streptomyces sp. NPDC059989]|uniref:hypothetical protein n=1 Tax=Streptomyces sp. NPDC059989 TaxID=3347026 RepID=UPI0036B6672B